MGNLPRTTLRILILGGYGVFGGRLAGLLADEPRVTLVIAGRSLAKARAFAEALPPGAAREAALFDRDGDAAAQLAAIAPDILVDASGPFQAYGSAPYRVAQACIDQGVHYLDLADGSDFVAGIAAFDAAADANGVFVLSGVSSFPVLTAAVVRALSTDMARVTDIAAGIAPSPYAGVGLNVIRAIASYAGRPVRLRRDGRDVVSHGLTETRRYTVRPPGRLPLNSTLFSLVDTPDLQLMPALWPEARSVWMGAGPVPEILHRMLIALARLVRLRLFPGLTPLAPLFHWVINHLRWGEHRGGMFIAVRGETAAGAPLERSWHLLAEGEDGPLIPSMAVEALVRRGLSGRWPDPGARAAVADLELADYEALFARRTIHAGVRAPADPAWPLYRRLLAQAWDTLPTKVRALHDFGEAAVFEGEAEVERGRGLLAALAAAVVGFPRAGRAVPVRVEFRRNGRRETWRRTFAGRGFASTQEDLAGRWEGLVCERFGPICVGMALVLDGERLSLVVRRWTLLGLPLPRALAPGGPAFESEQDGRFRFHVEIASPLTGLIVRYRGWLERKA